MPFVLRYESWMRLRRWEWQSKTRSKVEIRRMPFKRTEKRGKIVESSLNDCIQFKNLMAGRVQSRLVLKLFVKSFFFLLCRKSHGRSLSNVKHIPRMPPKHIHTAVHIRGSANVDTSVEEMEEYNMSEKTKLIGKFNFNYFILLCLIGQIKSKNIKYIKNQSDQTPKH